MNFFYSLCIVLFSILTLSATTVLPYREAEQKAKREKKDLLVLCIGSDWANYSEELLPLFKKFADQDHSDQIVWGIFDYKRNITAKELKALGNLPLPIFSYPAWIFMDCEKRPIWHDESLDPLDLVQLPSIIGQLHAVSERRMKALEIARKFKGIKKAKMIGQALDESINPILEKQPVPAANWYLGCYRALANEIKKEDPEDQSGYFFKLTFWFQAVMENIVFNHCNKKEFEESYRYLNEKIAIPVLTSQQKQHLIVFKYITALRAGDLPKAIGFLDEAIAVNPKNRFAEDCRRMKAFQLKKK